MIPICQKCATRHLASERCHSDDHIGEQIKKYASALLLGVTALGFVTPVYAGGETKEVCTPRVDKAGKPVMDKKTGKQTEDCKKIKVHKKVEGTKVPTK